MFVRSPLSSPSSYHENLTKMEKLKALCEEAENAPTSLALYRVVKKILKQPIADTLGNLTFLTLPKELRKNDDLLKLCDIHARAQWAIDAAQWCIARDNQLLAYWSDAIDTTEDPQSLKEIARKIVHLNIGEKLKILQKVEFFNLAETLKDTPDLLLKKCKAKIVRAKELPQTQSPNHSAVLPGDMLRFIFSFLDATSIVSASKVCREWQPLSQTVLWEGAPKSGKAPHCSLAKFHQLHCRLFRRSSFPFRETIP